MFRIIFILIFASIFYGCNSSMNHDITQDEFVELVKNAREFAFAREKSLTKRDKEIINENDPVFSIYYIA